MKNHLLNILSAFKIAFKNWFSKDPFRESAIIAYYAIFALPGLLIVIVTLSGYFFGQEAMSKHLSSQITSTLGKDTAEQIQNMIIKVSESQNTLWATVVGIITMLFGATGVFAQFQKSLNIIWEVKEDETKIDIWHLIMVRVFSFGLIISIAFMLIVSLVISTLLSAFGFWLSSHFSDSFVLVLNVVNTILSFTILSILFAIMFKLFPDAKIKWKHVGIGSLVTAFLFEIGKLALGLYFGKANPAIGYGTAGSVILILLWVSYSTMIVLFGAEFTHAYAKINTGEETTLKKKKTRVFKAQNKIN